MKRNKLTFSISGLNKEELYCVKSFFDFLFKEDGYSFASSFFYLDPVRIEYILGHREELLANLKSVDFAFAADDDSFAYYRNGRDVRLLFSVNPLNKDVSVYISLFSVLSSEFDNKFKPYMIGAFIAALLRIDFGVVKTFFAGKSILSEDEISRYIAFAWELAKEYGGIFEFDLQLPKEDYYKRYNLLNGLEYALLGFMASGINTFFIDADLYDVLLSGKILNFISDNNLFCKRVEFCDEFFSVLGAWYSGAKSLVVLSSNKVSRLLAIAEKSAIAEIPSVFLIVQENSFCKLPSTSSEGISLLYGSVLSKYGGLLYSVSSFDDLFSLPNTALDMAQRYQVFSAVLLEGFLAFRYINYGGYDFSLFDVKNYWISTSKGYKRYEAGESALSPYPLPGAGEEVYSVNAALHNSWGDDAASSDLAESFADKLFSKTFHIASDSLYPELVGDVKYKTLFIAYGGVSVFLERIIRDRDNVALLKLKQLYPLPHNFVDYAERADKIIVVEHNGSGEYSSVIDVEAPLSVAGIVLKYDGEEIYEEDLWEYVKGYI